MDPELRCFEMSYRLTSTHHQHAQWVLATKHICFRRSYSCYQWFRTTFSWTDDVNENDLLCLPKSRSSTSVKDDAHHNVSYQCRAELYTLIARFMGQHGPIWGRQDPGGPHVGPMNIAIWVSMLYLPEQSVEFATYHIFPGTSRCMGTLNVTYYLGTFIFHWQEPGYAIS